MPGSTSTTRPPPGHVTAPDDAGGDIDGARPRVLIVEDHHDTREMYAWCMRAAGWVVYATKDAEHAVFVAETFEPDVVVMDLQLPGLGGLEATRELKSRDGMQDVAVVACSGVSSEGIEIEARSAGCDEFVPKPCEPEILRDLLQTLVSERPLSS